jgi:hypothetical protein
VIGWPSSSKDHKVYNKRKIKIFYLTWHNF